MILFLVASTICMWAALPAFRRFLLQIQGRGIWRRDFRKRRNRSLCPHDTGVQNQENRLRVTGKSSFAALKFVHVKFQF
jgi:hypothetical protein